MLIRLYSTETPRLTLGGFAIGLDIRRRFTTIGVVASTRRVHSRTWEIYGPFEPVLNYHCENAQAKP